MRTAMLPGGRPHVAVEVLPAGLRPVGTGARVFARLLDGLLASVALAGAAWLGWSLLMRGVLDTFGLVAGIVFLLWVALALWAALGHGARLGGLTLGQRWVLLPGGQRAGWAVFGKFVAQAGIAMITLGVGEAIISLASIRPPLRRTWFDRITGVVLVTGRVTGGVPPRSHVDQPNKINQVRDVGLPGQLPPERPPNHRAAPTAPRPGSPGSPAGPIADVGVRAVNDGFIASLPFGSAGERVTPPLPEADPPQRPMVVRDRGYAATPDPAPIRAQDRPTDHTMRTPQCTAGATRTVWLRLDDGTPIHLDTSVVFGRDPVLPPDLSAGRRQPLTDPSMELSKTHLAVGSDAGGVWVVDLYSINGVRVAAPGAASEAIPRGTPVFVGLGYRIEFGRRSLEVCGD